MSGTVRSAQGAHITTPPGRTMDLSFSIRAVDAYHLVIPGKTYWNTFNEANRASSPRFQLKPGWRTVYARQVETALVRVTLSDGSVGWGEATEPICPEVICRLATGLLAPLAASTSFADPAGLWDFCYDLNRGRGHMAGYQLLAMAALDVAVWDALGHRHDMPVCAVLSAAPRRRVPVYLSGIRRASIEERVALLRQMTDDGLRGAKIFVDADTEATLREVAALRDGVPGKWDLMTDALWSYPDVAAAAEARSRLSAHGIQWLECPLLPEDLEGHISLAARSGVPIALGENFFTRFQVAPWVEARAMQILQPDICRTGFSDGMRQQRLAEAAGIQVTAHMGSGSPVVQAAALQFNAALTGEQLAEHQFDLGEALSEVFRSNWTYRDGAMHVPDAPGLGLDIDEPALRQHCQGVERWAA
jgi:L-alanine-DL-glutamate epimerase-like enolase superfamily enzyme